MHPEDGVVDVRLMNEYSVDVPLWLDDGLADPDDFDLSDELRTELTAFADRWEASISPEVYDDRWVGVPVMQNLVAAKYALGRRLHPSRERAAQAEDADMRRTGLSLVNRLQQELGPTYRVRYVH